MHGKDWLRYCDRCGDLLTKENNKQGYEICDKCNEWLEDYMQKTRKGAKNEYSDRYTRRKF